MLKLSFILPCYNVEQYIGRCLDSILNQDIPHDEYEIICVNDCSPDNLSNVVHQYQQKYPNIVLIEHTENKTAGGARNTGIDHAQGEYIWFVDPDDRVMPNSLQKLWDEVKECKVDILFFNNNVHTYSGECVSVNLFENSTILSGQDYLHQYFPNNMTKISSVWRELMRTEFVVNSTIRFPEIPASQDVVFLWELICNAQQVRSVDATYYSVFKRENSTTGTRGRCTARTCFSFSILYPVALLCMIKRNNFSDVIKHDLYKAIYRTINDNSKTLFEMSRQEQRKFYKNMLEHKSDIDTLVKFMNSMTRRLLRTYRSYLIWTCVISLLSLYVKIKSKL